MLYIRSEEVASNYSNGVQNIIIRTDEEELGFWLDLTLFLTYNLEFPTWEKYAEEMEPSYQSEISPKVTHYYMVVHCLPVLWLVKDTYYITVSFSVWAFDWIIRMQTL